METGARREKGGKYTDISAEIFCDTILHSDTFCTHSDMDDQEGFGSQPDDPVVKSRNCKFLGAWLKLEGAQVYCTF